MKGVITNNLCRTIKIKTVLQFISLLCRILTTDTADNLEFNVSIVNMCQRTLLVARVLKQTMTIAGENDQGCLGDNYCPPKCTCMGTVVRCSRAKLTEIPRGIPAETSEL